MFHNAVLRLIQTPYHFDAGAKHLRSRKRRTNYLRAKKQAGYIYLLKSEHGYKIGRAKSLKNRLSQFGLVLPFKTTLVYALKSSDYIRSEWHLHHIFAAKRIQGEWFNLTDEDVVFFKELGKGCETYYILSNYGGDNGSDT